MRLKSIGIANFKAYGPIVQTIPVRPITLIFGANSSGKSSLLHSLLWLNHASIRRDADVFEPIAAEKTVHLGGFDSSVHQNSRGELVKLYLELGSLEFSNEMSETFQPPTNVTIGLGVRRRKEGEAPSLDAWKISINDKQLMSGTGYGPNMADALTVDWAHPFLRLLRPGKDLDWERQVVEDFQTGGLGPGTYNLECHGVLPSRIFLTKFESMSLDAEYEKIGPLVEGSEHYAELLAKKRFINKLRYTLPDVVSDFLEGLDGIIEKLRYLPPLRSIPARFENLRTCSDPAWRSLAEDASLVNSVNESLGRLKMSHHLDVRKLVPATSNQDPSDYLMQLRILNNRTGATVSLQDVGVGTGQILPIVIEAKANKNRLVIVEQPEVHIHPALQADLGDVFIESALGENKNTFLLETHSEHLLLRIMKRIRQTSEGSLPKGIPPVSPDDVALLYVSPGSNGSVVQDIGLNERGELVKAWPGGFFEEGFNEMFD